MTGFDNLLRVWIPTPSKPKDIKTTFFFPFQKKLKMANLKPIYPYIHIQQLPNDINWMIQKENNRQTRQLRFKAMVKKMNLKVLFFNYNN